MIDVVVPSAKPVELLRRTLPALGRALARADVSAESVVIVDEEPSRDVAPLVRSLGFRSVETGGIGAGPARNVGAGQGRQPWILFVDDDVELDADALVAARRLLAPDGPAAVVGGLRPPPGAPTWLQWAYDDAVLTPASASAGDGPLAPVSVAGALLAIRRGAFDAAGGFPDEPLIEDSLLGLAIARCSANALRVERRGTIGGVHHYVPAWADWLTRCEETGRRLREVLTVLDPDDGRTLVDAHGLGRGRRAAVKRTLGSLPPGLWGRPRGHWWARAAAAAAEARGFLRGGAT